MLVGDVGGTPGYQLDIVFRRVAQRLDAAELVIARSLVGNYVTSLDMEGVSVTIAKVDQVMLKQWDAPVHTPRCEGC